MILKVNEHRAARSGKGDLLLIAAIVFGIVVCAFLLGAAVERRETQGEVAATRIQHARTAAQLRALRDDARVLTLCGHIRQQLTSIPEVCK